MTYIESQVKLTREIKQGSTNIFIRGFAANLNSLTCLLLLYTGIIATCPPFSLNSQAAREK